MTSIPITVDILDGNGKAAVAAAQRAEAAAGTVDGAVAAVEAAGAGALADIATDRGGALTDIDSERAAAIAEIAALGATGGAIAISSLAEQHGGTAVGSPATLLEMVEAHSDPSGRLAFGVLLDGTFFIGKYDATLAGLVATARGRIFQPDVAPYIAEVGSQIVAFSGSTQVVLTSEGNNTKPRLLNAVVAFLSDRFRGVLAPYTMNYDGTNQRAMQRSVTYEATFVTGQSLSVGFTTSATSTTAPYPGKALRLVGGPVLSGAVSIGGSAALVDLVESGVETISTSCTAALLDSELAQRPALKHVAFGHGYSATAYSGLKKGTDTYNDVLAQVALIAGHGTTIVRGFDVIHGEDDRASTTYEADLGTWQADYETDIKAATGQKEPVYLFVAQTASIRAYYPATFNAHKSALAQLAASINNPKIIFTAPEYFLTFNDDRHIDATSQRLLGEYHAKAKRAVLYEGRDWKGLIPRAFVLGSNYIDIQFWVPVAPLVLDTALCTDPGNYGFTYSDAASRTISSVALKGGTTDTVRITLSGAIGATAVIDYAYNNGTGGYSGRTQGARGCLRDSDPALSRWNGTTHLYNPCAIFRQALN